MSKQYDVPFLGGIELDPEIRAGGDRGLPVALGGDQSARARPFYQIARQLMQLASEHAAKGDSVLEIH